MRRYYCDYVKGIGLQGMPLNNAPNLSELHFSWYKLRQTSSVSMTNLRKT